MKNKTKLLTLLSTPVFLGGGFAPLFLNQCGVVKPDEEKFTLVDCDIDLIDRYTVHTQQIQVLLNNNPIVNLSDYTIDYSIESYGDNLSSSTFSVTPSGLLSFDPSSYDAEDFSTHGSSFSFKVQALIIKNTNEKEYLVNNVGYIYLSGAAMCGLEDGSDWYGVGTGTINIVWNKTDNVVTSCSISSCNNDFSAHDLSIPSYIWSSSLGTILPLIEIKDYAFRSNGNLTGSLTIPDGVTSIGNYAFDGCSNLTELSIGDSVTNIGTSAFVQCSKLSGTLTIPNSVTSIGNGAFMSCSSLAEVIIGDNIESIGERVFRGCSGLMGQYTDNEYPNNKISCSNDNVYYIRNDYTYYCLGKYDNVYTDTEHNNPVAPLNLNSNTKMIWYAAFSGCTNLITDDLNIPNSVTSIGDYAFFGCDFTGLSLDNSLKNIGTHAFDNCNSLTGSLTIPDGVTSIGGYAFNNCINLTELSIGDSVTNIGSYAFAECSSLNGNLNIPSAVTSIGNYAFQNCYSIDELTIQSNSINIFSCAFLSCSSLIATYSSEYPNKKISHGADNVYYARNDDKYYCLGHYENVTSDGSNPSTLTLLSQTKTIGGHAFYDCTNISGNLNIPDGVCNIGNYAFRSCVNLNGNLTIPNTIVNILENAFQSTEISHINLTNFLTQPSWTQKSAFSEISNQSGTISVTGGWNPTSALNYLKGLGLPGGWSVAS